MNFVQITLFGGGGTGALEGSSTAYNFNAIGFSGQVGFGNSWGEGFLGITSVSLGIGPGLRAGATVGNQKTWLAPFNFARRPCK
jgi:hypothetical protein